MEDGRLRAIIYWASNAALTASQPQRLLALPRMEPAVVVDRFCPSRRGHADVVLPASTFAEGHPVGPDGDSSY